MGTPISSIRNLGPATEAAFARAGIPDAETLRDMGADAAYLALMRSGAVDGLSFGYRVKSARPRPGGGRELLKLELIECSVVTLPMHGEARVSAVG